MAHGLAFWTPVAIATFGPAPLPLAWAPVTSGPRCHRASAAWSPGTERIPRPMTACMIVLARLEDFNLDGEGNPVSWKPLANGHFGTVAATRTLGWGTVLSINKTKTASREGREDDIGLNLAGSVGDQTDVLSVHCDVSLMDPADEPDTGDLFTTTAGTFCIFSVEVMSEHDGNMEMTVSGVRWRGCTTMSTPAGITPPMNWT